MSLTGGGPRMHQLYIPHNPCVIAEQPRCAPSLIILLQHSPANLCKKDSHVLALCAHKQKHTNLSEMHTFLCEQLLHAAYNKHCRTRETRKKKTKYKHIQAHTHRETHTQMLIHI